MKLSYHQLKCSKSHHVGGRVAAMLARLEGIELVGANPSCFRLSQQHSFGSFELIVGCF